MTDNRKITLVSILLFLGLAILLAIIFINPEATPADHALGYGVNTFQAEIIDIPEQGTITLGETVQEYQVLSVRLLEGEFEGEELLVDYGKRQLRPSGLNLQTGDLILVTLGQLQDGSLTAYFTDYIRTRSLLILFGTFVVFSILISGWKGVRGLLGMIISLMVIIGYIIPQIIAGHDPVWVSVTGAFFLLTVTLYLVYGWTLKTHSAVLGTFISLIITAFLARYFVDLTHLTGYGNEDALYLMQQTAGSINIRGLVLGGMLIGALGVLDDLVITQASVVFELHTADPDLVFPELFRRGMRVGQDHVAATVNTLVLAYAGAALPLFLLFSLSGEPLSYLVNLEYVTEEIVRTLVGSLGLMAAVPLTTAIACAVALYNHRLGGFRRFLGPETSQGGHSHSHHH